MTTTNSTPTATHPRFVVLKFGGTSVATGARWRTILDEARLRVQDGLRPVVVCSAISKVSDQLEQLVSAALRGEHAPVLAALRARHEELAAELGVDVESAIGDELRELERLALGASLVRERSPRLLARTMAMGELLATKLGAAFLNAQGLPTAWIDARTCLQSTPDPLRGDAMNILSATVHDDHEPGLYARFSTLPQSCVLTQGFIASGAASVHGTHSEDSTVLLGRGGSDTSAALFAARLQAERCEIWTDVPGIFTADPRGTPDALLVKSVSYDEAQEIASMGAKVLHPRSIAPCRRHHIPMEIRWTERPRFAGTVLDAGRAAGEGQVKAISAKRGVTLVSMETAGMWQQVGFLADAFACFKARGLSVDLVSTSEMNVTVSLDASANTLDAATLDALVHDLNRHCRARLIPGCAAVSLVGRRIRAILHQLGPVLAVFEEQRIHLVSQAASDLNLTFVVDEDQVDRLVHDLHALLFGQGTPSADTFGPSWSALFRSDAPGEHASGNAHVPAWWRARRDSLVEMSNNESPLYVLDEDTLDDNIAQLRALHSIDRIFYALKANPHVAVLEKLAAAGMGFECVSQGEVEHVRRVLPNLDDSRILFTPNFAPRAEVTAVLASPRVQVNVDNLFMLEAWPELFAGRAIFLRVDPGMGRGHHAHVKTGGPRSKFGIAAADLPRAQQLAARAGATVIGLHAHAGSGVFDAGSWAETALALVDAARAFPDVTVLDVGGGLGVPEKPGQRALDLHALDAALARVKQAHPRYTFWLEPGRFVVARAGALLARVTQVKEKGALVFVGVDAGMNTLIRPALYGAYHEIVNLSRIDEPATLTVTVVGPICESGDVVGAERRMPTAREGDVMLIGNTGAYGRSMSSHYNLRAPPREVLLTGAPR